MQKEEIVKYIENYKNQYSKESIENQLMNQGIDKNLIDEAYNSLQNNNNNNNNSNINQTNNLINQNYKFAGFWIRFAAHTQDMILVIMPITAIFALIGIFTNIIAISYLSSVLIIIYFIYFEGTKGATLGKKIVGIRVINTETEGNIGIGGAILRYVGKIASAVILMIGYLMVGWDSKKQGLHDKIASTYVIKDE